MAGAYTVPILIGAPVAALGLLSSVRCELQTSCKLQTSCELARASASTAMLRWLRARGTPQMQRGR